MAGQKSRKKGKTAGQVERALLPPPVFAVVPHSGTAPAAFVSPPVPGASKATMSPRLLGHPERSADDVSEPESSLCDYQQMVDAGYQTVGFGTWPARGQHLQREAQQPQYQFRSSGLYAEPGDIEALEDKASPDIKMISDIYATPIKKDKGKSSSKSVTGSGAEDEKSMTATHRNMHAEMKRIHDLPSEVNETMTRSVRHSANVNYNYPVSNQLPDGGQGSSRPGGRSSRSQRSVISGDVTDGVEVEQLRMQKVETEAESQTINKVAAALKVGEVEAATTVDIRRQVSHMKEENEILKSAVHRLNVELSEYQAKHRVVDATQLKQVIQVAGLPLSGPVPSWLISKKYLAPLFLAYDDQLARKDELIEQYKTECAGLKKRVDEVVSENLMLRRRQGPGLGQGDSTEWSQLEEQARLVLEENQVLMEQLEVQTLKSKDMYKAQETEISRMARKLALSEREKVDAERQLEQMRVHIQEMKHKYDQLIMESESRVSVQAHINTVGDLKRSGEELKEEVEREMESVGIKLKASEEERKRQASQLIDLSAENRSLRAEVKVMHKSMWQTQEKLSVLHRAIELSENKEMITQEQLANVIKVAEKTALERDTVYKVARDQQDETKATIDRMIQGSTAVGKLELKLKLYQMKASVKLNTVAERLREQDKAFNSQKKEYEREIQHLRSLLKERQELAECIEQEKRNMEKDLETMWQAATSENKRIQNILLSGTRKLKDYSHITEAIKDEMERQEVLHLSDDDSKQV